MGGAAVGGGGTGVGVGADGGIVGVRVGGIGVGVGWAGGVVTAEAEPGVSNAVGVARGRGVEVASGGVGDVAGVPERSVGLVSGTVAVPGIDEPNDSVAAVAATVGEGVVRAMLPTGNVADDGLPRSIA